MSGHSKWSQIKRQKAAADARRGMLFTKLSREIELAARQGGGDPATNLRLRLAIQKARDYNMPHENIERAIKRATGAEAKPVTELVLEGYGPRGVAILIEAATDNRNRTIQDIRTLFARNGGSLGENGCVSWIFEPKGVITIDIPNREEGEEIALQAIDAGAEDVKVEKGFVEVRTSPEDLEEVRKRLEAKNLRIGSSEVSLVPKTVVPLDGEAALATLRFLDKLEELPDVQKLYSNADFSEEALEQYRRSLA